MPEPDSTELSWGSWKLKGLPKWALVGAVAALLAGAAYLYIRQPERLNALLRAEVEELGLHIGEDPEARHDLMSDARGRMSVNFYRDLCVIVVYRPVARPERARYRLIIDLGRDQVHAASGTDPGWLRGAWWPIAHALVSTMQTSPCHGHSERPKTREVPRDKCLIEIHREWPDGCYAVQTVDNCHGSFSPIQWRRCVARK